MRPVNLIPPDARSGDRAAMRTGGVSYVVMAALALLLLAVIAIAIANKQKSDKQAEVERLNQDLQAKTAEAQSLAAFAEFGAVEQTRADTIASLAQSRFDWERVLKELALVLPSDVWLTELAGTVSPAVQLEDAPDIQIRDTINGPALEIVGCAPGQDSVAGFVSDLEDIDGVTRVGVSSSERPEEDPRAASDSGEIGATTDAGGESGDECRTRDFIAMFEIVVAFDEVPVPGTASSPSVPAPLAPGTGEVQQAQAQQAANQQQVASASGEAQQATNLVPGG
jgi:Tfp pilus assembly protein PilN